MKIDNLQLWQQLLPAKAPVQDLVKLLGNLSNPQLNISGIALEDGKLRLMLADGKQPITLSLNLKQLEIDAESSKMQARIERLVKVLSSANLIKLDATPGNAKVHISNGLSSTDITFIAGRIELTNNRNISFEQILALAVGNKMLPISTSANPSISAKTERSLFEQLQSRLLSYNLTQIPGSANQQGSDSVTPSQSTIEQLLKLSSSVRQFDPAKSIHELLALTPKFLALTKKMDQLPIDQLQFTKDHLPLETNNNSRAVRLARSSVAPAKLSLMVEIAKSLVTQIQLLRQAISESSQTQISENTVQKLLQFNAPLLSSTKAPALNASRFEILPNNTSKTPDLTGQTSFRSTEQLSASGTAFTTANSSHQPTTIVDIIAQIQLNIKQLTEVIVKSLIDSGLEFRVSPKLSTNEQLQQLLALLNQWLPNNKESLTSNQTIAPSSALQLSGKMSIESIMQQLIQLTLSARQLTEELGQKTVVQQLQSIRNSDQLAPVISNIPIIQNGQISNFEILFELPKKKTDKSHSKIYRVTVRFDLPPLGPMYARLTMHNDRINTRIYAERNSTIELLNEFMPVLEQSLATAGLDATVQSAEQTQVPDSLDQLITQSVDLRA